MKCEVGDIILINNFAYSDGREGTLHSFVVMGVNKDEFEIVNLDYLCFLVSSNRGKGNDVNPNYPFNEPIAPTADNGLKKVSHVKCDFLYDKIKENDIIMRIGTVTPKQWARFAELYEQYLATQR